LLGITAGLVLIVGFAAWRLSQGHIAADALRPAAEHWLDGLARGGRARVSHVDVVWFGASQSLGLQLRDVSLADRQGRPVLRAKRMEAGMALGSLAGGAIAPGHVAADDFFAAVSVSPQGRYELGYEATGEPGPGSSNLLRFFDDLTGKPRLGRPLSFLQQVEFSNGDVALSEVGGPVAWRGHVGSVRFDKTRGRLEATADMRVGDAALDLKAQGGVGLGRALIQVSTDKLDPARIFPHAGATGPISILDAPVGGRAWLSWANDKGVRGVDVDLAAGQGLVRLGGPATPFNSGQLRAAFDPASGRVLIQSLRANSAQANFDVKGQAWITPESRASGPARLELALAAQNARLSLDPRTAPAEVKSFNLAARYTPRVGRLELNRLDLQLDGSPFVIQAVLQRPKGLSKWGLTLDARIPGMVSPKTVVALWPKEQSPDARDWIRDHVSAGRLGQAVFRIRTPVGGIPENQPIREDQLRISYVYDSADIQAYEGMPLIHAARGAGALRGDEYDMTVQSASIEGVALSTGVVQIPRLSLDHKRIYIDGRAVGDAQAILQVVDKSTGGLASHNGFEPARLGGQGDATFSLNRYLESGNGDFQAAYRGVIRNAKVADATLGLTLKAAAMTLEGSGERFAAQGQVQLGPYRGPLRYETQFAGGRASLQRADLAGVVDASSVGFSGPAGATLPFSAKFEQRGEIGTGQIKSKAFDGQTQWGGTPGRFLATGRLHAPALRSIGLPVGKGVPDQTPVRLALTQAAGGAWSGSLEADAYSGIITVSAGSNPHFHYTAQLTPDEARRIGLGDEIGSGKVLPVSLDVATTGEAGAAAYGLGDWIGQVSWTQGGGSRTQYHWRTSLTAADLHALGMPAALEPKVALPLDVTLTGDAGGGFSGSAQVAGGVFHLTATSSAKGHRRMTINGAIEGHVLSDLGLGPEGMISGPTGLSAAVDLGPDGVRGGHIQADLQHAAFSAPFVAWRKPAGRAMQISADFARKDGGVEASAVKGEGPGFDLNASGAWKAGSGGSLRATEVRLEGAFDGSIDLGLDNDGARISTRARYFDARRLLQQPDRGPGGAPAERLQGSEKPFRVDAQLAQVRVSETGLIHNVKIDGQVSPVAQRRIEVSVGRDDGSQLVALKLYPDATGMAVRGDVSDVGDAAFALFGRRSFQGGKAEVTGHLVDGGADLKVEMTKVRLVRTPALARILTLGSLHGMSDTLNGAGIEFTKVVAPVTIRGGKMSIARARATGPAMGITTSGVIDIDNHTVDLSGGIAPSYLLNSAVGAVPVVGNLFVSHKGEGMFGLTYSAKGAFSSPKIAVNPLSLATPGILRRIFEGHSQASVSEPAG
jgi:hypothetical protein